MCLHIAVQNTMLHVVALFSEYRWKWLRCIFFLSSSINFQMTLDYKLGVLLGTEETVARFIFKGLSSYRVRMGVEIRIWRATKRWAEKVGNSSAEHVFTPTLTVLFIFTVEIGWCFVRGCAYSNGELVWWHAAAQHYTPPTNPVLLCMQQ